MIEAAAPAQGSPERRAKISTSQRGNARPHHVVEAVRKAHAGKPHGEEARARMPRNHVNHDAWTPAEDELVRALPPKDAAKATGRTLIAVDARRRVLKVPGGKA